MKPAVKRALAYQRITGVLPSHLHLRTWSACRAYLTQEPYMIVHTQVHRDVLTQEGKAATESHPLWVSASYLMSRGWKPERRLGRRDTSHYVQFLHPDNEGYALAYRHGGGSITLPIYTEGSRVFIRNETTYFTLEDARNG